MHNPKFLDLFSYISKIPKEQVYKPRRKFYEDTANVFRTLHASMQEYKSKHPDRVYESCECIPLNPAHIHRVSRMYRDLLSSYFHTLIDSEEESRSPNTQGYIERTMIQHVIAMWELADIMFFSTSSHETASLKILNWLNTMDKSFMKYDVQGILYSASPINHAEFWPMVHRLALRRQIHELKGILDLVNSRDSEAKEILDYLLEAIRQVPSIPSRLDGTDAAQFKAEERSWREQMKHVIAALDSNTPFQHLGLEKHRPRIMDTIKILQGDGTTIVKHAETPTEAMVALVVYCDALATTEAIRKLAGNLVLEPHGEDSAKDRRAMAYAYIIQGEVCPGLEIFPHKDWWHLAHLVDLFTMTPMHMVADTDCKVFSTEGEHKCSVKFRDLVILMYSRNINAIEDFWEAALDYLDTCSDSVREAGLMESIQYMPKNNPSAIRRLLDYAIEHDYKRVVSQLFKSLTDHSIDIECFPKAMEYFQVNGSDKYLEALCDSAIEHYCRTGQLPIFEGLRLEELNSDLRLPKANFYVQHIRLQSLVDKSAWAEAADLLYDILTYRDTPVDYLPLLFSEGTAVFEEGGSVYSEYQLAMLRSLLEWLKSNPNADRGYTLLALYVARVEQSPVPDREFELGIFKRTFSEFTELLLSRYTVLPALRVISQ